jgi:VWFA-related protein
MTGLLITLLALTAAADAPRPSQIQQQAAVRLVQTPLVATDRRRHPVRDLKPEEIEVKYHGRALRIDRLEPVRGKPPATEVRLHLDAPGGSLAPARSELAGAPYVVLLVDVENDAPVQREETARAAADFVRTRLEPASRVSVFSYDGKLNLELPFTDDRDAVGSALVTAYSRAGRPRMDPRQRMQRLLSRLETCVQSQGQFAKTADPQCLRDVANQYAGELNPRAVEFIRALEELARILGGLQGRKTVVALSHGLPIDAEVVLMAGVRAVFGEEGVDPGFQSYLGFGAPPRQAMDQLLDALVRERITLSFVDRVAPPAGDFQASRGEMTAPGMSPLRAEYDATAADMQQIATVSGGMHLQSTNVARGLNQVVEQLDGSYDLTFRLDEDLRESSLAKIAVSCTREGVRLVRRRSAYRPSPLDLRPMKGRFVLGRVTATPEDHPPAVRQPLRIEVDPRQIGYEVHEGEAQANFTVHVMIFSAAGQLADEFHFVNHAYDAELWKRGDVAPVTLTGWIDAPPGEYLLRAWIRNTGSGGEGTIEGPITIKALSP